MIIDNIRNASLYEGISPNVEKGLEWLSSVDTASLGPGRYEIDGNCFAIVQDYETAPMETKRWEAHRQYIDIQFIASDSEKIGWASLDSLITVEEYDPEKDITWLEGHGSFVQVLADFFVILLPHDAHMPGVAVDLPAKVRKIVVKVPV